MNITDPQGFYDMLRQVNTELTFKNDLLLDMRNNNFNSMKYAWDLSRQAAMKFGGKPQEYMNSGIPMKMGAVLQKQLKDSKPFLQNADESEEVIDEILTKTRTSGIESAKIANETGMHYNASNRSLDIQVMRVGNALKRIHITVNGRSVAAKYTGFFKFLRNNMTAIGAEEEWYGNSSDGFSAEAGGSLLNGPKEIVQKAFALAKLYQEQLGNMQRNAPDFARNNNML